MNFMRRMMIGRYGGDHLSRFFIALYLIIYLIALLFNFNWLMWIAFAIAGFGLYRMLSRNIPKRRAENERFLELISPVRSKWRLHAARRKDRSHCYFTCPNCGQTLRVPKGKGRIQIHCRNCGAGFEEKS